ncbi:MAG: F0F1 ATP synthase subunit delta [Sterolibacterium sp.]|nr:F0F1 ATP synthase subunit delta [Sterolibacterium sp.]
MAENVTIARPYAEAAFQLAREQGGSALAAWARALERMADIAVHADMQPCIDDPRLLPSQLTQLFLGVCGKTLDAEQQNFVKVLVDNDRLTVLPEIRDLFMTYKNEHEGSKQALIDSAFPIETATQQQLVADLERRFACKIEATVQVDPELIGGVRITVGDQVIDASVRGKLAAMATALQN